MEGVRKLLTNTLGEHGFHRARARINLVDQSPIVIIAFGHVTEEFHYAASSRKDIQLTNTFHDS